MLGELIQATKRPEVYINTDHTKIITNYLLKGWAVFGRLRDVFTINRTLRKVCNLYFLPAQTLTLTKASIKICPKTASKGDVWE